MYVPRLLVRGNLIKIFKFPVQTMYILQNTKIKRIFSEIEGPLDLNENLSTNIVLNIVS